MKLISPIDNLQEASLLLEAGADELYGGWVPPEWAASFGLLGSPNQRTFAAAQIGSFADLQQIVALAHRAGARFSLTLNAPFYTDEQMPLLLACVDRAVEAEIDGIILADLGVLRLLRRRHPGLEYHASTLAHLMNSAAVEFYLEQGIGRAVLPRHLPMAEMAEIAGRLPQVRFDAFILIGKCPNTEGLCTFHHSSADRLWPCEIPYTLRPEHEPASPRLRAAMARQASWADTDRRHGCGLCAIPALRQAGIYGLKLVGRGAPTVQKLKNLRLVAEFLRLSADDPAAYRRRARQAHRQRFGSLCSANVCYYPEFLETE